MPLQHDNGCNACPALNQVTVSLAVMHVSDSRGSFGDERLLQGTALESSLRLGPLNAEQQLQARLCLACCGLTCMGMLPHHLQR